MDRNMRKFILLLFLLLEACATGGVRPLRPYEIATAPYRFGEAKPVLGTLMYEGGCLLFRTEGDTGLLMPVWPTGTRFEESLVTFHEPGRAEQRVVLGEEVRLDTLPLDWATLDSAGFRSFHHQCGGEPIFVSEVTPAN
jgi:hypothetical protein